MANYIKILGDKYWDFNAYDFADTKQEQDFVIIQSFEDFGEYNITPKYDVKDEYEILISYSEIELDLFQNNIEIPISNKPIFLHYHLDQELIINMITWVLFPIKIP